MSEPIIILNHAMQAIGNEMFKNGPEEGCRIWEDYGHPLHQALQILLQAEIMVRMPELLKERAAMIDHYRLLAEKSVI
jgi:hypothetical protein